jgi:hypothetical protein
LSGGLAFFIYAIRLFALGERIASLPYYYIGTMGITIGALFARGFITGMIG